MIYTETMRDQLIDSLNNEAEYSDWDEAYVARNLANYNAVPIGTDLDTATARDFEAMIADGDLDEADLTPAENVILSYGYFYGYR